jgi:L-lactate utilization protein LutB
MSVASSVERTIDSLRRNGFAVKYFESKEEAKTAILEDMPLDETVGFAGSVTVDEMKIYEALVSRGSKAFWHWKLTDSQSQTKEEVLAAAASADVFLSGTNAITEYGSLVNIDGTGNRLSGMLYGHKKVYIVVGVNKIAGSYEEAMLRIKNVASPANAKRLNRKTPCATLGKCMNCDSEDRICKATLIIDRQPGGVPITLYLINENLGF